MTSSLIAIASVAVLGLLTLLLAALSKLGQRGGDSGPHWARMCGWLSALALIELLIYAIHPFLGTAWTWGWLLYADIGGGVVGSTELGALTAALVPIGFYFVLGLFSSMRRDPPGRSWLAGSVDYQPSRRWALILVIPILGLLLWSFFQLGTTVDCMPLAPWVTNVALLWALVMLALGSPAAVSEEREAGEEDFVPQLSLGPWVPAMKKAGFALEPATTLAAKGGVGVGPRNIHPRLISEVRRAFGGGRSGTSEALLVLGPDGCGQLEVTAGLVAEVCSLHQSALIIVRSGARALAGRMAAHLPPELDVVIAEGHSELTDSGTVWIVDVEMLSDRLQELLARVGLRRLGLLVWWDVHDYSGVLAANTWAISRRLERFIEHQGRESVRKLVFARKPRQPGAQMPKFCRNLLPYTFHPHDVVQLESYAPKRVELHRLLHAKALLGSTGQAQIPPGQQHLPLLATWASGNAGWRTVDQGCAFATDIERQELLQKLDDKGTLCDDAAEAGARVLDLSSGDILALSERVCQGGRAAAPEVHHVAVARPVNPYARWLLSQLGRGRHVEGYDWARRLVGAAGQPKIVERHLQQALSELPDIRSRLLNTALLQDDVLRDALQRLADSGHLVAREVRYVDDRDDLKLDWYFTSKRATHREHRPLDTVGADLIDVVEAAGGEDREGVRMRVDPERLCIQAYPGRVFMQGGRRYKVRDWTPRMVNASGQVYCEQQARHSVTWRRRAYKTYNVKLVHGPVMAGGGSRAIARYDVQLNYRERVNGYLQETYVPEDDRFEVRPVSYDLEFQAAFDTRAVLLGLPGSPSDRQLLSVAEALRCVLPVHVGVDSESFEVIYLRSQDVGSDEISGVAIVDLYPDGVGIVQDIYDDHDLLFELLDCAYLWLSSCPCQKPTGCPDCLLSTSAKAVSLHRQLLSRRAAVELLEQVVTINERS